MRLYIVGGKIYYETGTKLVVVAGKVLQETTAATGSYLPFHRKKINDSLLQR